MKHWNDCSTAEKLERWTNTLRVLRATTRHQRERHFDMANWGIITDCGTVACTAGLCGLDLWFVKQGFAMIPVIRDRWEGIGQGKINGHEGRRAGQAVRNFFGKRGSDMILFNDTTRKVGTVIGEVRRHLTWMKKTVDLNDDLDDSEYEELDESNWTK